MRRKNINNQIIRESITEALLILMENLSISDITISALTRKAGVSRVSFYRNYKSKEEVLVSMLEERSREWWEEFKSSPSEDYIESFFEACLDFKGVAGLLKKQSLEHLLLTNIQNLVGPRPQDNPETAFKKSLPCRGSIRCADGMDKAGYARYSQGNKRYTVLTRQKHSAVYSLHRFLRIKCRKHNVNIGVFGTSPKHKNRSQILQTQ